MLMLTLSSNLTFSSLGSVVSSKQIKTRPETKQNNKIETETVGE